MQDTFWTPELWCDFLNQLPLSGELLQSEMARFKSSKFPKKEPVIITEDGVERVNGDPIFIVGKDFQHYAEPDAANDFTKGYYSGQYIFSTKEAADKFIMENKPMLSLNDVKEALFKQLGDTPSARYLLEPLTALVKQKLNQ